MEEEKSKSFYEEELQDISPCTEEEMEDLFLVKDERAVNRLVEGNLHRVYEAAKFFETEKISFMDLVQEGNLALFMFVAEYEDYDELFGRRLDAAIHEAMENMVNEENENEQVSEELKVKLNVLDEVCVTLAEKYGREATSEEVAEVMKMDESDVKYLMKIALSAINKEN